MTLTWAELDDQVDSLSAGLSAAGLVAGQRVAFALANSTTFVVTYLAVARCGLVAVPMNPHSATGELVRMLADSGARLVVGDSTTADALRAAVADQETAPALAVDGAPAEPGERPYDELLAGGRARVVSPADPENLAALLYTSGTSGRPRGAMLSHRALLANIEQVAAVEPPPTRPDDVVLGLLPLFHVYGLNAVLGQVLAQGASLVLVDRFDPEETLRLVAERAVTNVPVAPPVVAAWAGRPDAAELLAGVRLVLSGAGPARPRAGPAAGHRGRRRRRAGVRAHRGGAGCHHHADLGCARGRRATRPGRRRRAAARGGDRGPRSLRQSGRARRPRAGLGPRA